MSTPAIAAGRAAAIRPASFAADWLAGQLSQNTARAYRADIRQFVEWFGSDDLTLARRRDLFRYRAWLVERYTKAATINRKLSAVRQLFAEAVRHGAMVTNIAEGIRGHKTDGQQRSTLAPSVDELHGLLGSIEGEDPVAVRDRAIIRLLADMGLRRDEVVQLRLSDIGRAECHYVVTIHGKGSKDRRLVVPGPSVEALLAWIAVAQLGQDDVMFQPIVGGRLTGRSLHVNSLRRIVVDRLRAANLETYSPHAFRHFNITQLLARGVSIYDVQRWAGHADPRTTAGYDRAQKDINNSPAQAVDW